MPQSWRYALAERGEDLLTIKDTDTLESIHDKESGDNV